MMTESEVIDLRDLPDRLQSQGPARPDGRMDADGSLLSIEQLSRLHAHRVLAQTGGNKVRAAEILGISRTHLYELLKRDTADQRGAEPASEDVTSETLKST